MGLGQDRAVSSVEPRRPTVPFFIEHATAFLVERNLQNGVGRWGCGGQEEWPRRQEGQRIGVPWSSAIMKQL
jgi:hypothetical protein